MVLFVYTTISNKVDIPDDALMDEKGALLSGEELRRRAWDYLLDEEAEEDRMPCWFDGDQLDGQDLVTEEGERLP